MDHSTEENAIAALIKAHEDALARWESVTREIQDARHVHDELEKAHEGANGAEREALSALMAFPVETLDDARLKAAYFLNLAYARDFADDISLLFMRSLADGKEAPTRNRS